MVGTNSKVESEGYDRVNLDLPGRQDDLVRAVAAVNPRTVVIVNAGLARALPWADDVAAVVLGYFGGQEFGTAMADVLTGAAEPGGRLPTHVARALADVPVTEVTPTDGVPRLPPRASTSATARGSRPARAPAFAFGHGLGYTTWSSGSYAPRRDAGTATPSTVTVTNTGDRAGKQVVQVYAERADSAVERPARWLVGFAAVRAEAGETVAVSIPVPARRFAHWDGEWVVEPGAYTLRAGSIGRRPAARRDARGGGGARAMSHPYPNPLIPGFNPDPSVVRVGDECSWPPRRSSTCPASRSTARATS